MKDIVRVGKIEQLTTDGFVTDSISVISANLFTLENIRSAGIRCELCRHRRDGEIMHGEMWCHEKSDYVPPDFFCADHSALQDEGAK